MSSNLSDIDFVITWVDGSDKKWLAERKKYAALEDQEIDNSEARFRDWDLLRYWFRSVEENAPWVRKIHFVTYGHIPEWLNTKHPKLHIVKHEDFIDKKYLPTFNSCAIEINLHKIPGLSEKFVYFNDDTFLNKKVSPSTFFENGLPKDSLILKPIYPLDGVIYDIQRSCMKVINRNFKKTDINKKKLFCPKSGIFIANNLVQFSYPYIVGVNSRHLAQGFTKKIFNQVERRESKKLAEVSSHKFRAKDDVSQWLFQYWQLISGSFSPTTPRLNGYYSIKTIGDCEKIASDLRSKKSNMICTNDSNANKIFDIAKTCLTSSFKERYPERSSYEI